MKPVICQITLILIITFFCVYASHATSNDSLCREKFFDLALADIGSRSKFVKIDYEDSNKISHSLLCNNYELYQAVVRNKKVTYNDYKALIKKHLRNNSAITYKEIGSISIGYVVQRNAEVEKQAQKGKLEFLRYYFENGEYFDPEKHKRQDISVFAVAFDFGILIEMVEGWFSIAYNANCPIKADTGDK